METESLGILLVDGDAERADRLRAMLQASAPIPVEITYARGPVEESEPGVFDVAVLSLDEDQDPLAAADELSARLPEVPMITVGGRRCGDPAWCIDRGIQEHLPRRCLDCQGGSRLITALRWAAERNRLLRQVEFVQRRSVHMALHDPLTGMPNRKLFRDRLRQLLARSGRHDRAFAVMFIDLDRFKQINDTLGHEVGDQLLVEVAERLRACLREGDTAARWGGDEFIVLLEEVRGPRGATRVASEILEAISRPFHIRGRELFCSASIGITLFPSDGTQEETLVRHADIAMYEVKSTGGNDYRFFDHRMNERALERLELEYALRKALGRGELELHYQPQYELRAGRLVGFEALLRWHHPERGWVAPGHFIPIAEETGLILPIGDWTLRAAARQVAEWRRAGHPAVPVAVNLSARQFHHQDVDRAVEEAARSAGIEARWLELELTESAVMREPERTEEVLSRLRRTGVRISIDDFGTGYSSLGQLRRFPIDRLKIDRTFVERISHDRRDAAIARAMVEMARCLGVRAVAEGLERRAQLEALKEMGCEEAQGYLLGRPLPPERARRRAGPPPELFAGTGTSRSAS